MSDDGINAKVSRAIRYTLLLGFLTSFSISIFATIRFVTLSETNPGQPWILADQIQYNFSLYVSSSEVAGLFFLLFFVSNMSETLGLRFVILKLYHFSFHEHKGTQRARRAGMIITAVCVFIWAWLFSLAWFVDNHFAYVHVSVALWYGGMGLIGLSSPIYIGVLGLLSLVLFGFALRLVKVSRSIIAFTVIPSIVLIYEGGLYEWDNYWFFHATTNFQQNYFPQYNDIITNELVFFVSLTIFVVGIGWTLYNRRKNPFSSQSGGFHLPANPGIYGSALNISQKDDRD